MHAVICVDREHDATTAAVADVLDGRGDGRGAQLTELRGPDAVDDLVDLLGAPTDGRSIDLVVVSVGTLDDPTAPGGDDSGVGAALRSYLDGGGGILAMRPSLRTCEAWPPWPDVIGALWDPDVAGTAPTGRYTVEIADAQHPVVDRSDDVDLVCRIDDFEIVDAPPVFVDVRPDVTVLATVRWQGRIHPVWWACPDGAGRLVYDGLGADPAAPVTEGRRAMLQRAVRWCVRPVPTGAADDPQYELELRDEDVAAWTRPVSRDPSRRPG